jgi:hypothetical protein
MTEPQGSVRGGCKANRESTPSDAKEKPPESTKKLNSTRNSQCAPCHQRYPERPFQTDECPSSRSCQRRARLLSNLRSENRRLRDTLYNNKSRPRRDALGNPTGKSGTSVRICTAAHTCCKNHKETYAMTSFENGGSRSPIGDWLEGRESPFRERLPPSPSCQNRWRLQGFFPVSNRGFVQSCLFIDFWNRYLEKSLRSPKRSQRPRYTLKFAGDSNLTPPSSYVSVAAGLLKLFPAL